jgi:3-methyladenine DNA glycosylase AlkC
VRAGHDRRLWRSTLVDVPTTTTSTAFKDQIDAALIDRLGVAFAGADPAFDAASFRRRAADGLAPLELKARISHVAAALGATLPARYSEAVAVVDGVFSDPSAVDAAGLSGWDAWPVVEWAGAAGRDEPDSALELLARLTRYASAEFAIRPYIDDDPDGVHERLSGWVDRDDEHVRRLVSEGTRPKLPWAPKLATAVEDPAYAVHLLDRLVDDPSEYVRRSVSNHLNDLCRVDPALARRVAGRWLGDADERTRAGREWVVRRGLRTLVKAGDADALRLLGHEPDLDLQAALEMLTPTVEMGGAAEWVLRLRSLEADGHEVIVDYAIHHVRSDGSTGRKVAKWTTRTIGPGGELELRRRHAIRPITTRTYHSGVHLVEVQVNGTVVASGSFELRV